MNESQIAKLAQVISNYMGDRDISARAFAAKADVSPSYVYKILNKEQFSPTIDMMAKISKAMGIELGKLLAVCGAINTSGPQKFFSTSELFDKIPSEYKELFRGKNERYLQFAQELLASEVDPENLKLILEAYLKLQGR